MTQPSPLNLLLAIHEICVPLIDILIQVFWFGMLPFVCYGQCYGMVSGPISKEKPGPCDRNKYDSMIAAIPTPTQTMSYKKKKRHKNTQQCQQFIFSEISSGVTLQRREHHLVILNWIILERRPTPQKMENFFLFYYFSSSYKNPRRNTEDVKTEVWPNVLNEASIRATGQASHTPGRDLLLQTIRLAPNTGAKGKFRGPFGPGHDESKRGHKHPRKKGNYIPDLVNRSSNELSVEIRVKQVPFSAYFLPFLIRI